MKTSGWKESERRRQASLVALLEVAASRLRRAVMPLERSGAAWLNGQVERVSRGGKCAFLALFILGAGGYSAYLVACGMAGTAGSAYRLLSATGTQPAIIHEEKDRVQSFGPVMDGEPYLKIHRFTLYIDSLKNSVRGKRIYDSLRMNRPGLMDSLRQVENLYQSPFKTR